LRALVLHRRQLAPWFLARQLDIQIDLCRVEIELFGMLGMHDFAHCPRLAGIVGSHMGVPGRDCWRNRALHDS